MGILVVNESTYHFYELKLNIEMKNVICHTVSFQELNSKNVLVQAVLNTIKVEGVFGLYVDYLYPLEGSAHDVSLEDAKLFKRRIEDYAKQTDLVAVKY